MQISYEVESNAHLKLAAPLLYELCKARSNIFFEVIYLK